MKEKNMKTNESKNLQVAKVCMGENYVRAQDGKLCTHLGGTRWVTLNKWGQVENLWLAKWIAVDYAKRHWATE